MKTWDHFEYKIAKYYLPAFINGDYGDMVDAEIETLSVFVEAAYNNAEAAGFTIGHWADDSDDDTNFARCEVTDLYADVATVRLMVWKET